MASESIQRKTTRSSICSAATKVTSASKNKATDTQEDFQDAKGTKMQSCNCDKCGKRIDPKPKRRIVNGRQSVGFECPHCKVWYHGYWDSDELEQDRNRLDISRKRHARDRKNRRKRNKHKRAMREFAEKFDGLQKVEL